MSSPDELNGSTSPSKKAQALKKFFAKTKMGDDVNDWDEASRGAYSTISKMRKSRRNRREKKASTTDAAVSVKQAPSYLWKLDGFLERTVQRRLEADDMSRGAHTTTTKSRRVPKSELSGLHLVSTSPRKDNRHLKGPQSAGLEVGTPIKWAPLTDGSPLPSLSFRCAKNGDGVRSRNSPSATKIEAEETPDRSRRSVKKSSARTASPTKQRRSKGDNRSRKPDDTEAMLGNSTDDQDDLQNSKYRSRNKAKSQKQSRNSGCNNTRSTKKQPSGFSQKSGRRRSSEDNSKRKTSRRSSVNSTAGEGHSKSESRAQLSPQSTKWVSNTGSGRTEMCSSKKKTSDPALSTSTMDGNQKVSRNNSFGDFTKITERRNRRGSISNNNKTNGKCSPTRNTVPDADGAVVDDNMSLKHDRLKTSHMRRLVAPERQLSRQNSTFSGTTWSGSHASTSAADEEFVFESMWRPPMSRLASDVGECKDTAPKTPFRRSSLVASRRCSGSTQQSTRRRSISLHSSNGTLSLGTYGHDLDDISVSERIDEEKEEGASCESSSSSSEFEQKFNLVDGLERAAAAAAEDVFTFYTWSRAGRQNKTKIQRKRDQLRESLRDTPFFVALERSQEVV